MIEFLYGVLGIVIVYGLLALVSWWFGRRADLHHAAERRRLVAARRARAEVKPYARERW